MLRLTTFSTAAAVVGLTAALSTPAAAMTCEDFNNMSEETQNAALMGMAAGRDGARAEARGDDPDAMGEETDVETGSDMESGREGAREDARGADEIYTQTVQLCSDDPSMDLYQAMNGPTNR